MSHYPKERAYYREQKAPSLHQLVHVFQDIKNNGPPRFYWMYGPERLNKYLKGLLKNKSLQSIVKNYSLMEKVTFFVNHKIENLERLFKCTKLAERTFIEKFMSPFKDIYIESHLDDDNKLQYELHGIRAQRVIQLMGPSSYITLDDNQVCRLLHSAAERVNDDSCLLYCLLEAHEEHIHCKTEKIKQNLVDWIRAIDDIPYHLVPDDIPYETVMEDWRMINDSIHIHTIFVRRDAMIGGTSFTWKFWNKRATSLTFVVKPLQELLSKNSSCQPDSFISFLFEKSPTLDDYRFGRAVYFFRLSLSSALQQHPFVYVDHIKNDKVYTNLSSAQTTIVNISEHSWTRTVLDDYKSGQNLNVFLSCYSLLLTNIAVIANPSSSTSTS